MKMCLEYDPLEMLILKSWWLPSRLLHLQQPKLGAC
jgi:hypothetical protein